MLYVQPCPLHVRVLCWLQALLLEKDSEIKQLVALVRTLQERATSATQAAAPAADAQAQLELLESVLVAFKPLASGFTKRLDTLNSSLQNLRGDALLAAAVVVYGGALPRTVTGELVVSWTSVLDDAGVACTVPFSLCEFMRTTHRQHALLPCNCSVDDSIAVSLYAAALVRLSLYRVVESSSTVCCVVCDLRRA